MKILISEGYGSDSGNMCHFIFFFPKTLPYTVAETDINEFTENGTE